LYSSNLLITSIALSEQHPREQGLKHDVSLWEVSAVGILSEQHPREQGLKLACKPGDALLRDILSEQHPREQGLKLVDVGTDENTTTLFQSNIQENKD